MVKGKMVQPTPEQPQEKPRTDATVGFGKEVEWRLDRTVGPREVSLRLTFECLGHWDG